VGEPSASEILETTAAAIRVCTLCGLHAGRTHAVPGEGSSIADVFLIGEAPGKDEDASGRPFVGSAGKILYKALGLVRLPRGSVFITNVVKCRPPKNRKPLTDEMGSCRPYLMAQIAAVKPSVIVTLGRTALRDLLGPGMELKSARTKRLAFGDVPVVPTYHPAAVLYNRKLEAAIQRDLRKAARMVRTGGARRRTNASREGRTRATP